MKYYYIAIQICENNKYYAYALKCSDSDNLLYRLRVKNIVSANLCPTTKRANEIVNYWNECYKLNGNYLFDDPLY